MKKWGKKQKDKKKKPTTRGKNGYKEQRRKTEGISPNNRLIGGRGGGRKEG